MAWTDRLRGFIKFVSPSGLEFSPLWKGDDISAAKRLGRHAYPNLDKEVVQDLGMNSRNIPLTVYFDGPDNDKKSKNFESALFEPEVWSVTHPVDGLLKLQLISYKRSIEPVERGNVTVFETEWIEPADEEDISAESDPDMEVEASIESAKKALVEDMAAVTQKTASESKITAIAIKQGLTTIKNKIQSANAEITSIQAKINNLILDTYLDIASITGGIIELLETPGLISGSLMSKVAMFTNLGQQLLKSIPITVSATANIASTGNNVFIEQSFSNTGNQSDHSTNRQTIPLTNQQAASIKNVALTTQMFLNIVTFSLAETISENMPETRKEALSALMRYRKFVNEVQSTLDAFAEITAESRIEHQYIAQANSGEAIATLNAALARYIMTALYNLKIEKRIILNRPRAPLEIAITEYKATGENADYYFELFCKTNNLHGRELLLLPTEREVMIYV